MSHNEFESELFVKIDGFDQSKVLNQQLLRPWLIEELPWSHILRERISFIVYIDESMQDEEGTRVRALCHLPKSVFDEPAVISLYRQEDEVPDRQRIPLMRHSIYHEVAHTVYARLRGKARKDWVKMIESLADGPPIFQGRYDLSPTEDFAESYAHYVQQPKLLRWRNSLRYEFLRTRVFGYREYFDYTGYSDV